MRVKGSREETHGGAGSEKPREPLPIVTPVRHPVRKRRDQALDRHSRPNDSQARAIAAGVPGIRVANGACERGGRVRRVGVVRFARDSPGLWEADLPIHAASGHARDAQSAHKPRLGHTPDPRPSAGVFQFKADLDLTELDTRGRPGATWSGKGIDICRSGLWFRSRKLCYPDRELLLAVHLVDDQPTPLCGVVAKCDYDGEGLYVTQLTLQALPRSDLVKHWLLNLHARGGL